MHDWEDMASIVGRKLVENGKSRILQRIYDGITSNWVLDVADDKGSLDHLLIHLVWRKFPRNRHLTEEQQPTVSTQTEEASSPTLGLAASADLTGLPPKTTTSDSRDVNSRKEESPKTGLGLPATSRNSNASDKDCDSVMDLAKFSDLNDSASSSNSEFSDGSYSKSWSKFRKSFSPDWSVFHKHDPNFSAAKEGTLFTTPAKRRTRKPLSPKKEQFQTQISNRFACFGPYEEGKSIYTGKSVYIPETSCDSSGWVTVSDRESFASPQRSRPQSPLQRKVKPTTPEVPQTSGLVPVPITDTFMAEIPTTSTFSATDAYPPKSAPLSFLPQQSTGPPSLVTFQYTAKSTAHDTFEQFRKKEEEKRERKLQLMKAQSHC